MKNKPSQRFKNIRVVLNGKEDKDKMKGSIVGRILVDDESNSQVLSSKNKGKNPIMNKDRLLLKTEHINDNLLKVGPNFCETNV